MTDHTSRWSVPPRLANLERLFHHNALLSDQRRHDRADALATPRSQESGTKVVLQGPASSPRQTERWEMPRDAPRSNMNSRLGARPKRWDHALQGRDTIHHN